MKSIPTGIIIFVIVMALSSLTKYVNKVREDDNRAAARAEAEAEPYPTAALREAAWENNAELARALIANGANVNGGHIDEYLAALKNAAEKEAAERASEEVNAKQIAEMLINWSDTPVRRGAFGDMPLHLAALKNAARVARVLIDNGAEVNAISKNGKTPLDWAAEKNAAVIKKLLLDNGATR